MALGVGHSKGRDNRAATAGREDRANAASGEVSGYRKRVRIFSEGEALNAVWEIVEGSVIVFKTLSDGRRQITDIARAGGWLGALSGTTHTSSAETLTKAKLRRHSISNVAGTPQLLSEFSDFALKRLDALQDHALLLGRMSALERIASFLLALPRLGVPFGKDRDAFTVALKQRDIGDYLGLKVETVSRNLTKLRKLMIIATGKRGQFRLLDREALRLIAVCD